MAHPAEPMDIDNIDSDFDNKENTFHHNNVQPCTEKGYEELDVSELNMRLRYSVTPAASPMSKSYTSYVDNRSIDSDDSLNTTVNDNLTRSLNSTMTKNDSVVKSLKSLPLQSLPTDQSVERSASVLRQLDSTITCENNNITVTVSGTNDIDENLSSPSTSSSAVPTPEATTPTKDIPKSDGGSPIMRGLKSVLNMFRSSQSPIPPPEPECTTPKQLTPTPTKRLSSEPSDKTETKQVLASTPISTHRDRDAVGSKRNSPLKDSITFNDDLEKELQWKDETTILFSQERIPIHKLFYQQKQNKIDDKANEIKHEVNDKLDITVEYMDISYNDSIIKDRSMAEVVREITKNEFHIGNESDSEFLDCETESNATKTQINKVDHNIVALNEEKSFGVKKPVKDITFNEDNHLVLQQNDETSIENIKKEEILENQILLSFNQKEHIDLSNKLTPDNNINNTNEFSNLTQEENIVAQQIKINEESTIEKSELNADVSITINDHENKNISKNNMLDVSTLESHTESLSSLIESLDVTKSFCEDKLNIKTNNTHDITMTFIQDNVNLGNSSLELKATDEPAQVPDAVINPNVTVTLHDQGKSTYDGNTTLKEFTLNLLETSSSSLIQNLDSTMKILNQEKAITKGHLNIEDKKGTTTFDINNESIQDVLPVTTSTIQPIHDVMPYEASKAFDKALALVPTPSVADTPPNENTKDDMTTTIFQSVLEMLTQEDTQVIHKTMKEEPKLPNESPADAPLPDDDDDIVKDNPTDIGVIITDTASSLINTSETENKMTIENTISEIDTNDKQMPDMLFEHKDYKNENDFTIAVEMDDTLVKEEATDSQNICPVVANTLPCLEETTAKDKLKNIDITRDMQRTIENQTMDEKQMLSDVVNQSMNDAGITVLGSFNSQTVYNVGTEYNNKVLNLSENCENQLLSSINDQEKNVRCNEVQSNIGFAILSDNQIEASLSAREDILDKNREISEVFLTEQKIDKLQHANNVTLCYQEGKIESLPESQYTDKNELQPNCMNITFNHDVMKDDHPLEVDSNIITAESHDANKTVPEEQHANIATDEKRDIPKHGEISVIEYAKLDNNETVTIETAITNKVEQEIVHKEGNNITETVQLDECKITNKTMTIEDVKKNIPLQLSKQEEPKKTIDQDKQNEKETLSLKFDDRILEKPGEVMAEDEIIVSENNSPYVSVAADLDKVSEEKHLENFEEIESPLSTKHNIPSSPPITSKGYNFNFDEIEDPFASNVKIRMSPTLDSSTKTSEIKKDDKEISKPEPVTKNVNKNRRRSQPIRQKLPNNKKTFNNTFDGGMSISVNKSQIKTDSLINNFAETDAKQITSDKSSNDVTISATVSPYTDKQIEQDVEDIDVVDAEMTCNMTLTEEKPNYVTMSGEDKDSSELIPATNTLKNTSSSEQSTYYSAGTSSSESIKSRNVFNLPEIDDMNFNPFATKSKIHQSPPHDVGIDNPFATKNKVINSPDSSMIIQQDNKEANIINIENNYTEKHLEDKMETEPMEKDSSANISSTTNSSKATENDVTIREINTEDEDTIEGPFLEAEEIEDKQSDFDSKNVDIMQFNDRPVPEHDENADGELFIDAEAFEFLLNQNKSNVVADSGKESLFLKFDPLFAKRMSSDSVVAALSRVQKRQSTPTRTPRQKRNLPMSDAGPSTMNLTYEADSNTTESIEDVNITVSKPTMVVTPAVNPTATLRKSVTPTRSNRRSITFTSPAMAVIDRLLSLSANNSFAEQETVPQVSREQNEAELALTQLREVLAEKEIHVYNLRSESKELKDRLSTLESQMKLLETEGQERLKKINDLNEKLSEKTKMNKSMAVVVEEYERTIASLIAETEQDKKRHAQERIALMNERDEQTAHLASMEVSFNDLHSKYEKSKQVIMNYKTNEENYKQSLKEFEENVSKMQKNYELLKQHATSKLNHANDELQKMNRAHEAEVLKLNAMIKRKDLHITSLEETLAQKTKANEELTAICDELINKVG